MTGEKILYTENGTIHAKLINALEEEGGTASKPIENIDRDKPNEASVSFSSTTTDVETPITATVTQTDKGKSGVDFTKCRWKYSTETGTPSSYTGTFSKNDEKITLSATTPGTYYLHILTIDRAGNPRETIRGAVTVKALNVEKFKNKQTTFDKNTQIEDSYGNSVTIPKGFKIASDSANDVTGGVVIEDVSYGTTAGSQFVWVPVGTIKGANGTTKTIQLSRYTFASNGTPTNQGANLISGLYEEIASSTRGNTTAKNLNAFITSASTNHGYYIARYQAAMSSGKLVSKRGQTVYRNATQPQAAQYGRDMYGNGKTFNSDLVNSYAWDTALMFIQQCSGSYAYPGSYVGSYKANYDLTGGTLANGQYDVKCGIYDLASGYEEWTTETSRETSSNGAFIRCCVSRKTDDSSHNPSSREGSTKDGTGGWTIRTILYL